MSGYLYVLELKNRYRYYGSTSNLNQRIKQHRDGLVTSTKGKFNRLLFSYQFSCIDEAKQIEMKLKKSKNKTYNKKLLAQLGKSAPT